MKISSISAIALYVKDLDRTTEFYEKLGFRIDKRVDDRQICYVNWFKLEFRAQKTSLKAGNALIYVRVEIVDDFYKDVIAKGFKPLNQPTDDKPANNREFTLEDPDGHRLVFFDKLK